ncbi:MarR family winged helix-turn-helix transcriptional regulator [Thermomonospora cellulosilytica]|uniref:DNA-binding MarR family transcriptional regulator n=1 Tax=Thermomonospora cellulosilytica TaxID=1411118 RepID=A0A7W3N103_9ACTN|nr:MarR family transcriptional regulator [Thermomonospora cellulosilytica]MBA9005571.1 DNA-binding MarR family transcriptional regulator [Thermomonospora cellulosilytica]
MTGTDEEEIVRRWRALLGCYSRVSCALDRALQDTHGIGMSEFEALDRLAETGADKCKMHRLGADMYLSQSALSRTVARLERAGLVERGMCPDDRRAVFVSLTDAGRDLLARARVTQRAVLAEHLADEREATADAAAR